MRLLDRLVLRELLPPFGFGVALFTTLIFAGGYLGIFTEYAVGGVPFWNVAELAGLFLLQIMVKTLPMGMLLATLLGFGRLSTDWEVTALRAAGISVKRIMLPVLMMSLIVSFSALAFNEIAVPWANRRAEYLRTEILKKLEVSERQVFGFPQMNNGKLDSYVIVAGGRNATTQEIYRVTVIKYGATSPPQPEAVAYAERAIWQGTDQWRMEKVWWMTAEGEFGEQDVAYYIPQTQVGITQTPTQIAALLTNVDSKSFRELRDELARYRQEGADPAMIRQLTVELYNKISLPLAAIVFALLGAPLGIRPQRTGTAAGFALSIAIIFLYWVMARYLIIIGRSEAVHPLLASCLPNLLGVAFALWLIRKRERT